ncbi:hypothetical protein MCG98_04550 [Ruminococcus sp. OA3]|uniref:hypothetical protein n=1 Tax=Ruminococcus sp. OA3 TaxID=2914164 RepID=UPI001F05F55D|nr:hypothetical protein [Ruminococcus sp. OA3]MCH1981840.1 hypothetical protein [Ruminococcus sp. OA3]
MENTLQNLDEYRKSRPMDVQAVINMGMDLCEELEQYRQTQEPHCDIKTSNILVTESGKFKLAQPGDSAHSEQTADLYALGLLMYRLLNKGRMPFMPEYPQKATAQDKQNAMQRCMAGDPFPDPVMGGSAIAEVLRKTCHIRPEERYLTAGELKLALESVVTAATMPNGEVRESTERTMREEEPVKKETKTVQPAAKEPEKPDRKQKEVVIQEKDNGKKEKKIRKKTRRSSSKGGFSMPMPRLGLLQLWVTLSALAAAVFFILVRAGVLSGLTGLKGYIFCGVQIVLCALCSSTDPDNPGLQPTVKRGILKFLWILTTLDSLFVILYSLILRSLLDKYGIPLTSFYVPGLISMTAPILAGIIYWVWSRSSERIAYHKLRICATFTAAVGIVIVILGITGFNKSFSMVELYPYWLGALQLVLALLCIVNANGRPVIKTLCVLTFVLDIVLLFIPAIQEKFSSFGLPEWVLGKAFCVLTFLIPLIAWLLLFRPRRESEVEQKIRKF